MTVLLYMRPAQTCAPKRRSDTSSNLPFPLELPRFSRSALISAEGKKLHIRKEDRYRCTAPQGTSHGTDGTKAIGEQLTPSLPLEFGRQSLRPWMAHYRVSTQAFEGPLVHVL